MRGLDPRIHGLSRSPNEDVDARDKRGHDDWKLWSGQPLWKVAPISAEQI
jgi:hypothetical protein